jgi:hypothetical protein
MRTTVTIDPDVEQLLRDAMHARRQSFKKTLNDAIRSGLAGVTSSDEPPFKVESRAMGLRTGIDPARLNQLYDELEVESFLKVAEDRTEYGDGA